jgi:hypothetical protein
VPARRSGDLVALGLAVIGESRQGLLQHRVHRVGDDKLGNVHGVGVVGFFTPVEAHSGRCGFATCAVSAAQRVPWKTSWKAA